MKAEAKQKIDMLRANIEKVFVGKPQTVRMILIALFAEGHVLIEDMPGVGKTILTRALAKSIACSFKRIQFTPDLLPSDIIGVTVYNSQQDAFVFKKGAVFANIVLADEINRTTPRTQSSLLEAMSEQQVSVDGKTYPLPAPFVVAATQNPFEFEGTYPLPESQMDRFMIRIDVGYPSREAEKQVIYDQKIVHPIENLGAAVTAEDVVEIQKLVRSTTVDDSLTDYLMAIVEATRNSEFIQVGASPRGSIYLFRTAQANAVLEGRDYVIPDDIKKMSVPVLGHRIIPKVHPRRRSFPQCAEVIRDIVKSVPVPA